MRAIVFTLCLALAGCQAAKNEQQARATPTPTPTPKTTSSVSEAEILDQILDDDEDAREAARNAAAQAIKTAWPQAQIKGIAAIPTGGTLFRMLADIELNGKRTTVILFVCRYYPEHGESYWKASLMNLAGAHILHDLSDYKTLKELEQAKSDLDEARADDVGPDTAPRDDEGHNDPRN
jgi:hypothetical protein